MERYISVDTGSLSKLKDEYEALDYIAKAGFKQFDLSLYWREAAHDLGTREDYVQAARKLREYADNLGLKCIQTHSYFTGGAEPDDIQRRISIISQDIKATALMGAHLTVVHPICELNFDDNVKFFKVLEPIAKENHVKLAIENVWGVTDNKPSVMVSSTPENLDLLLNKLNDDIYGICLDIGHAEMGYLKTSCVDFIKKFGDRISTVHIHDNDKWCDLHQIPYTYEIDFETIFNELAKVNYKGPVNFEVERCYGSFPKEIYPAVLNLILELGKYFRNKLDK